MQWIQNGRKRDWRSWAKPVVAACVLGTEHHMGVLSTSIIIPVIIYPVIIPWVDSESVSVCKQQYNLYAKHITHMCDRATPVQCILKRKRLLLTCIWLVQSFKSFIMSRDYTGGLMHHMADAKYLMVLNVLFVRHVPKCLMNSSAWKLLEVNPKAKIHSETDVFSSCLH